MRIIAVFFYGLFMDESILKSKGIEQPDLKPATVNGFCLKIGKRATLVPDKNGLVYGVVANLTQKEIDLLYAEPSVQDYKPETVIANLEDGKTLPALCFNLIEPPSPNEKNNEYAKKLKELAKRLGFPNDYVESIK